MIRMSKQVTYLFILFLYCCSFLFLVQNYLLLRNLVLKLSTIVQFSAKTIFLKKLVKPNPYK